MGYRNKLDIIADMLHVTLEGAKKTQIMYRANLNYGILTKRLFEIRKACLVNYERKRRCYLLTSKGKQFLEMYEQYLKCISNLEKQVDEANGKKRILENMCSRRE